MYFILDGPTRWEWIFFVAALFLAVPIGLFVNLVTPALRNWWAERSTAAMTRRLAELEVELGELEGVQLISDAEVKIVRLVVAGTLLSVLATVGLLGVLLTFYSIWLGSAASHRFPGDVVLAVVVVSYAAVMGVGCGFVSGYAKGYLRRRSRDGRLEIAQAVENLRARLRSRVEPSEGVGR